MWEVIQGSGLKGKGSNGDTTGAISSTYVESARLKVPGGWLVRTITSRYHAGASVAQTFVPDADYSWSLT